MRVTRSRVLSESERAAIVRHMNADHADALALYARAFAGLEAVAGARLADIDADTLTLEVEAGAASRPVRIPLAERVTSPAAARRVLIRMARAAREKVGGTP